MNENLAKLELHKVEREISTHGREYIVYRQKKDKYGEDIKEHEEVKHVCGIFHTQKGYATRNVSDGSITHTKGQPMLLMSYEESDGIENGDVIYINDNKYKLIDKNNIQQYNIVVDISMELVLDGRN